MTKSMNKADVEVFKYVHPVSKDVFVYQDKGHAYSLNGEDLPGTTTPLELVNELSWGTDGKMTSKSAIIQKWAINLVGDEILVKGKEQLNLQNNGEFVFQYQHLEEIVKEAKIAPNKNFKSAGVSGTAIHNEIEKLIKKAIQNKGFLEPLYQNCLPQVANFVKWANTHNVRFLYSEEPIYSKEWMNCGTVDFICEIDGKILVGDIKTSGDKRKFQYDAVTNKYDYSKPVTNIKTNAFFQAAAYAKMITEDGARKLLDKVDGVVIVNIMKGGEFVEELDVKYNYNLDKLIAAYNYVINLYKIYVSVYKNLFN